MKRTKRLLAFLLALGLLLSLVSCGAAMDSNKEAGDAAPPAQDMPMADGDGNGANGEQEAAKDDTGTQTLWENPFVKTETNPVSTFSADVDTASYALLRKLISAGYTLAQLQSYAASAPLRTEELVNYFDYATVSPAEGELFGVSASVTPAPWNDESHLMMLGLATEQPAVKGRNNLVFLIDVSGSMAADDKLPLLKNAFSTLVSALDEQDTVSIVTYSGKEEVVLSGCAGDRDEEILQAIDRLEAKGATNGESGLQRAYQLAADYYIADGNNRIIMASDGDLNVGISSPDDLERFIAQKRQTGIYLSVMGFGTGNYRDDTMSALAQNGNGVYYYIDSAREAQKVLGTDLLSTLYTVAEDVKLRLTFDAAYVSEYRLIGYESRMLSVEDFDDDTKDAGEVGAGHTVVVCYELKLTEAALTDAGRAAAWMKLAMRYKPVGESDSVLTERALGGAMLTDIPSEDIRFVASVIELAMIVNRSAYNENRIALQEVFDTLSALDLSADEDKREFQTMLQKLL